MADKQRAKLQRKKRRQTVAEMYFRLSLRQQEIADQLGVTQATISRDVKALLKDWQKVALGDVDKIRSRELADLAEMERDASLGYQRTNDPKWLAERRHIKERRAKMLGLDAAQLVDVTSGGEPLTIQYVNDWRDQATIPTHGPDSG